MIKELSKIDLNNPPTVLLVGNGILKSFGSDSWSAFIDRISKQKLSEKEKEILEKLPYPLQPVVTTSDNVEESLKHRTDELTQPSIDLGLQKLIQAIGGIGADAILTTNYTYELEAGLCESFKCKPGACKYRKNSVKEKSRKTRDRLYRYFEIPYGDSIGNIWHIHGEAAKVDTMVLGHYYYGNLLSTVQKYITNFKRRYEGCKKYGTPFKPKSWVDYFILGDVYTIGFGMDVSELDIWWLVNCKKRCNTGTNIHFYEPNMRDELKMLADAYDIDVHTEEVQNGGYIDYYYRVIDETKTAGGNKNV